MISLFDPTMRLMITLMSNMDRQLIEQLRLNKQLKQHMNQPLNRQLMNAAVETNFEHVQEVQGVQGKASRTTSLEGTCSFLGFSCKCANVALPCALRSSSWLVYLVFAVSVTIKGSIACREGRYF